MDRSSVLPVTENVNTTIMNTIAEAEKILKSLPLPGDPVEVVLGDQPRKCADSARNSVPRKKEAKKTKILKPQYLECSRSQSNSEDSASDEVEIPSVKEICGSAPNKTNIVPGSIKVCPLTEMVGVVIDLSVSVRAAGGSRVMEMRVECPNFVPKRIRTDGVWKNVV